MGVLVVFLDGVGIGPDDPDINPFLRAELPVLRRMLGGVPTLDQPALTGSLSSGTVSGSDSERSDGGEGAGTGLGTSRPTCSLPLDARLGVDGLPQSGTGQTTLFTGRNAARSFGRHFGPWVPVDLRPVLAEHSFLRIAQEAGHRVTFANAYPAGWMEMRGARRPAAPPLAAHAAGVLSRTEEHLVAGDAVASEIVHDGWRRHLGAHLPEITPEDAGSRLARIAGGADLTLYAHYTTDTAGHRGGMDGAITALQRVDAFLGGVLAGLPPHVELWVVSDHGNVEDVRGGHTLNPALGLVVGQVRVDAEGADSTRPGMQSLLDVTPAILNRLGPSRAASPT